MDCSMSLACFSQALIQESNVQVCLDTIREVSSLLQVSALTYKGNIQEACLSSRIAVSNKV